MTPDTYTNQELILDVGDGHQKLPNSELAWVQAGHGNDRNTYEVIRTLLLQISRV